MTESSTPKRATPRTLKLELEFDVTEGPRLRPGIRAADLVSRLVEPAMNLVIALVIKELGLKPTKVRYRTSWGYTWLDASDQIRLP